MKKGYECCRILCLAFYLGFLYQFWHMCRYGEMIKHAGILLVLAAGLLVSAVCLLVLGQKRKKRAGQGKPGQEKNGQEKTGQAGEAQETGGSRLAGWAELFLLALGTFYFGCSMISMASSHNGVLSRLQGEAERVLDRAAYVVIEGAGQRKTEPEQRSAEPENPEPGEVQTEVPEGTEPENPEPGSVTPQEAGYCGQTDDGGENITSFFMDQTDGTMYFFLNEGVGWRLVVLDAAAGSRFYGLEKTENGGNTWETVNGDPFGGQIGVVHGLLFQNEDLGVAGLAGASAAWSGLYVTRDGGASFTELVLPLDTVTQLPETAAECGFTVEDYDYLYMPEMDGDCWKVCVTTDAADGDALVFYSEDAGMTWTVYGGK